MFDIHLLVLLFQQTQPSNITNVRPLVTRQSCLTLAVCCLEGTDLGSLVNQNDIPKLVTNWRMKTGGGALGNHASFRWCKHS